VTERRRRDLLDQVISTGRRLQHKSLDPLRLATARRARGPWVVGRVSFSVATYDRIDILLERTIPALLAQTHADIEVIVVGDGTPAPQFARLEMFQDPRVRLHRLPKRTKYPNRPLERWMVAGWKPRNVGASLATGEWLAWISDDDELLPEGVERLMAAARAHPDAELITGAYQVGTANPQIFTPKEGIADLGFPFGGTGWMMRSCLRGFRWSGHSWRNSWNRPSDYDLVARMRSAGVRFAAINDVIVVQHEVAGTGLVGRRGALAAAEKRPR
jgi:glycosyltransferase involved in cell wall biosynthesis